MNFGPVAGIDVSKRFSDMCILSPDNKIFAQEKIYHDETSINRANTLLQKAEQIFSSKPVIVMESTSHYHLILFQFFSEHGYDVIVVNPLQSSSMKDFSIRKRKTDRVDAFKLAMMYRTKTLRPSQVPQTALRALRQLCRERVEFLNDVSSYKNRLTAFLDQAFPGYDKVFSDLGGITSCAVLVRFPTPAILLAAEEAELVEVIAAASKSGYGFAKKKAELLVSAAQKAQTLGIHSCADETLIVCTIQMLRTLSESVFQIEKAIDNLLAQIKEIRNNIPDELEIEAFVHGAMCISHSGRCLLSNYFTGRDANHGACTHPCRWKYAVMEESRPGEYLPVYENERGTYIFNSKDLCMVEHIPELIDAGIDSLKIEGRMKTALYVATVARTYRKALDDFAISEEHYRENMDYYHSEISKCTYRQFTTGFYFGKTDENSQIYTSNTYEKEYTYIGIVQGMNDKGMVELEQRNKFSIGETIDIMVPTGENETVTVRSIEDEDGVFMESAPHPKQKIFVDFGRAIPAGYLLRRKEG